MIKKVAVAFIVVLAAGAIAAFYWSVSGNVVSVRVTQLGFSSLHKTINTNGKVEASKVYELHAPFAGACRNVVAHEGEYLERGQPVLAVDDPALRSDLAAAQAELDTAGIELRNVRRGVPPEELNQAEADVSKLELQLQHGKKNLETNEWLFQRNAIAKSELDQSRRAVEQLEQSLSAATIRLRDLKTRFTEQDLKRAASRVEAAQARLQYLEGNEKRAVVRSPIAGTLYHFTIKEGAFVNAGDLLGYMADFSHLRVRAYVDEPDLGQISKGAEVLIHWSAYPGISWKGTVQEIPPEVTRLETRSVAEVLCSIDSARNSLIPNINVDVEIASRPGPKIASLPRSAVFTDGESQFVWLLRDSRAEKHIVRTGQSTSTLIEVTGGLSASDRVIIPGDVPITEGMRVQVTGE